MEIPKGCIPVRLVKKSPFNQSSIPIIRGRGAPIIEMSAMGRKDFGPMALEVYQKDPATGKHVMMWQDPKYRALKKKEGTENAADL